MDGWVVLKIFWATLASAIALALVVWSVRARGLFSWRKRLTAELAAMEQASRDTKGPQSCGMQIVAARCRTILQDISPEVADVRALPVYIQSIAACYHPAADRPELQATVGAFLKSFSASLDRLDHILKRPGFKRIRKLNIRQIRATREWYRRLTKSPLFRWWLRHRTPIRQIAAFRFFIYADPFMLLAYASNRLTILVLLKYLLVDLYLFLGKVAVEAFERTPTEVEADETSEAELRATLEELSSAGDNIQENDFSSDPQIIAIRRQLVGFTAILSATPTPKLWWTAIIGAADVIARKHFPDAPKPIEEAVLGPLLDKGRFWIETLGRGEQYVITRQIYRLRLETVFRAKDIPALIPGAVKSIIGRGYFAYGWFKWPLRVYRWAKRRSPWSVAVAIGWQAAKKASLAYLYGRAFDHACRGLESVYRDSLRMR